MAEPTLSRRVQRKIYRLLPTRNAHFIHIGKTGGTAIRAAVRNLITTRYTIHVHPHAFTLADVPEGERAFFVVRDPVTRFVSAFYSRQRQGRPRYDVPWRPEEAEAFRNFKTPNELAAALSANDQQVRDQAVHAMKSISHIRDGLTFWLVSADYLRSRARDILFIARQETLDEDFERLRAILRLPRTIALPTDDVAAHRNPRGLDKQMDAEAERNVREWYRQDYEILAACEELMAQRQDGTPIASAASARGSSRARR